MSHAQTGRVELWPYGWSQRNFWRIKVKCIPNHYQRYFTKLPYLEVTWVHSHCSKTGDFRTLRFEEVWTVTNTFLYHMILFPKKRNGKYQAVIFLELKKKKPDVLLKHRQSWKMFWQNLGVRKRSRLFIPILLIKVSTMKGWKWGLENSFGIPLEFRETNQNKIHMLLWWKKRVSLLH